MSNETYRQFDPWRPSPVKEISRRQIVETHYFNVDHVSYESNQIGSFERYFVQENNGDTVAVLAVTDDGMIPLVEQYLAVGVVDDSFLDNRRRYYVVNLLCNHHSLAEILAHCLEHIAHILRHVRS